MQYISDLKEGDQVVEHYLCVSKQILKTKSGKTYYSLLLQDKTGIADAKIWDLSDGINNFEEKDYIKIDALVVTFQGNNQLNIRRLRKSSEGEYDPKEYVPTSDRDIDEMYNQLLGYINSIEDPFLNTLACKFFVDDKQFVEKFKEHTAAKTVHHSFMGGLLEHTLSVVQVCEFFANQYPIINRDLLYTAALFHDIGKIDELSSFPVIEYTDAGQLMGHIVISVEWVNDKIKEIDKFPQKLAFLLKHCILAHHGELEYGSPKKPAIIEAIALHFADNVDAKIKTFETMLSNGDEQDDWLGWQRLFDSNMRRTRY